MTTKIQDRHPFGELLAQYRARKPGLTQTRLAELAGYDQAILVRMAQGKKDLTGPSGRERVLRLIETLADQGALTTLDEANGLLLAASLPPLFDKHPTEARLITRLARTSAGHRVRRTNLPAPLTGFIGRAEEIAQVRRLLGETRLLTLTGAGGCGKTRLAQRVAADVLITYADGVWYAELASLTDPALIADAVARAFGLVASDRPTLDQLTDYLRDRHALIVLDNCEHLIDAVAAFAIALLQACPRVSMLTTSREALNVDGETAWRVPPMQPDEASRLFIERAHAAHSDVTLGSDDPTVRHICARLDGMPLAIELAAARLSAMSLSDIAARLDDRFTLLAGGRRGALPRHQTLRALIDWSYDALSEPEQIVFRRLGVFVGGWTLTAAEAIHGTNVSRLLDQLANKSLIVVEEKPSGMRYRLLETIRQYAIEKLQERGEEKVMRDRHLSYCLNLAEETMDFDGPHVDAWLQQINPDYDNMRAAFAWACTRDDRGEQALRLSAALRVFWRHHPGFAEGIAWLDEAMSRGTAAPASARARALLTQANLYFFQGDLPRALSIAEASLNLFRTTDDRLGTAWGVETVASLASSLNLASARDMAEEALTRFRELHSLSGTSIGLRLLGISLFRLGNPVRASVLLEEAIAVAIENGSVWFLPFCLGPLSIASPKRALELCERELARLRETGNVEQIAILLTAYGDLLFGEGAHELATRALEESIALWQLSGIKNLWLHISRTILGFAHLFMGRTDQAMILFARDETDSREAGAVIGIHENRFYASSAQVAMGNLALAAQYSREYLQQFYQLGARQEVVCSLIQRADQTCRMGNLVRASRLLGVVQELETTLDPMSTVGVTGHFRHWHRAARRTIVEPDGCQSPRGARRRSLRGRLRRRPRHDGGTGGGVCAGELNRARPTQAQARLRSTRLW